MIVSPRQLFVAFIGSALCFTSLNAQHPRDLEIPDGDTRAWWHTTEALSGDSMEGRDTGSPAYQRAAEYVAKRFEAAGLKPAGDGGSYFQNVPMHEVALDAEATSFTFERTPGRGEAVPLAFLREISLTAGRYQNEKTSGALTFRGYCGANDLSDVNGKFVICFGARNAKAPTTAAQRATNVRGSGALGMLSLDDPSFTLEPARWPDAYSRSVSLAGSPARQLQAFLTMRLSAAGFAKLLAGSEQNASAVIAAGATQQPLAAFDLPGAFTVRVRTTERDLSSPNVLAALPGTDPKLKDEYLVVAAHLDGYGFGTAVNGDNLYNGTLDDAAYVALLIQFADDLRDGRQRTGVEKLGINTGRYDGVTLAAPKRSILFCVFTGEEKGLLGSNWFITHPTVPVAQMAADINLDQLRPLFPLKILTALAINDTTLGQTAREVGKGLNIELREDREPERGLLRRADHFPFLRAGVPAIGFIFGYDPGTDAERRYREWYDVRYHRPQDDLTQPMDFHAALSFNVFFYRLVETVADAPERPHILRDVTR